MLFSGQISRQQRKNTIYRSPWQYSSEEIQSLTTLTKSQFFDFVLAVHPCVHSNRHELRCFSACLLFLRKMAKNPSFKSLATDFVITEMTAINLFYKICVYYFKNCINIPLIINGNGVVNNAEVDKLLENAYNSTQPFFSELVRRFHDPSDRGRLPILINCDATYLDTTTSGDLEMQKYLYYDPRSGHCVKLVNITNMSGKFLGVLPLASSQSPASGDGYLTATYVNLMDRENGRINNYLRAILRGNSRFFVILVCDAGFVMTARNAPSQLRNVDNLVDICNQEHCVLLHTSSNHHTYHLSLDSNGEIVKVPVDPNLLTHSENVVRLTRMARKPEEQAHSGLKGSWQITNAKKMRNTFFDPFSSGELNKFGLDRSWANVSKMSYIAYVACSLYNSYHAGFRMRFLDDAEQIVAAQQFVHRLFLENPFNYPHLFPIQLDKRDRQWNQVTVAELQTNDILNFPKLTVAELNPTAIQLCGGTHALSKCDNDSR